MLWGDFPTANGKSHLYKLHINQQQQKNITNFLRTFSFDSTERCGFNVENKLNDLG